MVTTTIELPVALRDRLKAAKEHPRQAYHEVISAALDTLLVQRSGRDQLLAKHRPQLRNLCAKHGVEAKVIGSRAGTSAGADDDLDLVIHLKSGRTLFDLGGFLQDASKLLPTELDIRSRDAIPPSIRKKMLAQAVAV